jgi:hypothetical protein
MLAARGKHAILVGHQLVERRCDRVRIAGSANRFPDRLLRDALVEHRGILSPDFTDAQCQYRGEAEQEHHAHPADRTRAAIPARERRWNRLRCTAGCVAVMDDATPVCNACVHSSARRQRRAIVQFAD